MDNYLISYCIAIGMEITNVSTPHFKFIKREKIDDGDDDLLKRNGISVDLFNCHFSQGEKDSFKKLTKYKTHSNYD